MFKPGFRAGRCGLSLGRLIGLLGAILLLAAPLVQAQDVQPVPALTAHVIDRTQTLDASTQAVLEAQLATLEQQRGSQVVVLLVPTTAPEDIASYANRVANAWKIGRRKVGDGVLLIVAKNGRKIRIEVAKTLEGAIPDLAAKQIIDEALTPNLRRGDFAGGLSAAVSQIDARIAGENLPAPTTGNATGTTDIVRSASDDTADADTVNADTGSNNSDSGPDWGFLGMFLIVIVPLVGAVLRGFLGRGFGTLATGGAAGAVAYVLSASLLIAAGVGVLTLFVSLISLVPSRPVGSRGRSGSGFGGFGGGFSSGSGDGFGSGSSDSGFSSGGGGDFGGGGASGDF